MDNRTIMRTVTGSAAYNQLTAYLSADDHAILEKGLSALPESLCSDAILAEKILNGCWKEIFDKTNPALEHFPLQALRCLRAGLITDMTFSTSQMFYNIFTHADHAHREIRIESIYQANNNKRNINSCNMIEATMRIYSSSYRAYLEQKKKEQEEQLLLINQVAGSGLATILSIIGGSQSTYDTSAWNDEAKSALSEWDNESKEKFYALLKALPASEQQFLVLPDPHFDGKSFTYDNSVTKEINYNVGFNVFGRFRIKEKADSKNPTPVCMIPTRGMMHAFLEATRPATIPTPIYRFGLSPVSGLYETMKAGGRDMYQSFAPLAHLNPKDVDGHPALPSYAGPELHDFYHQSRAANVPANETKLFAEIAGYFFHLSKTQPSCTEYAAEFGAQIADMEHGTYNPNHLKKNPGKAKLFNEPFFKFWRSFKRVEPKPKTTESMKDQSRFAGERKALINYFIDYLITHEAALEKLSGMTLQTLLQYETDDSDEFLARVKRGLREHVHHQIESKNIGELAAMAEATPAIGRMLREAIDVQINQQLKDNFIKSIQIAHRCKSALLISLSAAMIGQTFKTFYADGTLSTLKQECGEAFESIMSIVRETQQGSDLLYDAISKYEDHPEMFNMLYDKRQVNKPSRSGNTLVYQAIVAKNTELLLRLTNDGASIIQPADSKKPTALQKANDLKCKDIQALLILAHQGGAGWVNASPTCVERLRRLANYRLNNNNSKTDTQTERDLVWMKEIISKVPAALQREPGRQSGLQNENTFFVKTRNEMMSFILSDFISEHECKK